MELSLTKLATKLDSWHESSAILITETDGFLILNRLDADIAREICPLVSGLGWAFEIEDNSEAFVESHQITEGYAPYRVTVTKPKAPADVGQIVSRAGLAQWFGRNPSHSRLWVASLDRAFETFAVRVAPWGDAAAFKPRRIEAEPRNVVKEAAAVRTVESDLSKWLLRRDSFLPWEESTFQTWARISAMVLAASLASEIVDDALLFRGPPTKRLPLNETAKSEVDRAAFATIQRCALWVAENEREYESRHGLFAAEFARSPSIAGSVIVNLRKDGADALEGAKIAYQLNLMHVSRDALRAMADLRKAVSDEAAKLSDSTRQLATAVAGAWFGGIGLIVARLTVPTPGPALSIAVALIGLVLVLYVGVMIKTGVSFMQFQRSLRAQWRARLYGFLPDNDYQSMVATPAKEAEDGFKSAATLSAALAGLLLVAFVVVAFCI